MRAALIWASLATVTLAPIAIAANSPYLTYRNPAYIIGGFAGIAALSVLLIQPLLAANALPIRPRIARALHHRLGGALIVLTLLHIAGLYLTSPADTLDALLLRSPTPFSIYGVIALCGVLLTAALLTIRKRLRAQTWAIIHNALALIIVLSVVIHALLIEGAMGYGSKWILCSLILGITIIVIVRIRILRPLAKPK